MSQTSEYSKFNMLDYNRDINRTQIEKLKDSYTKHGYLTSHPIVVDEKMAIIDGQHRFIACKEMGLPIVYEIIDDSNNMIIDLNTTQKKWTLEDYINYYARRYNNKNYLKLQKICYETNLRANTVMTLIKGCSCGNISKEIKSGNLKIKDSDEIEITTKLKTIKSIADYLKVKCTVRFIEAALQISKIENFKYKKLISQAEKYPTLAYNCITRDDYVSMLRNIYNYNQRTGKI